MLTEDKSWKVRAGVAENPNTSARILFDMARIETEEDVLKAIKNNPNYSADRLIGEFVDV